MIAPRSRRPGAWIAAASALAACLAVAACSAGQQTQTSSQVAAVPGTSWTSPDRSLALRDIAIAYGSPAGYPKGGTAPLVVRIFNNGAKPVALTAVTSDAGRVVLRGAASPSPTPTPTPQASTSAGAASASPGASAAATPSPSASPADSGLDTFRLPVPAGGYALLIPGRDEYLQLAGLTRALGSGDDAPVTLTFTFDNGVTATLPVRISPPLTPAPRQSAPE